MKRVMVGLMAVILLVSCKTSTETKLKDKIIEDTKNDAKKANITIESLQIDSVEYKVSNMRSFWENYDLKIYDIDKSSYGYIDQNGLEKMRKYHAYFDSLIDKADTTLNLYEVDFRAIVKTNKNSFNTKEKVFMRISDLEQIRDTVPNSIFN